MKTSRITARVLVGAIALAAAAFARADVITDWDEQGVALASFGPGGQREMAILHLSMFDAVNSIERKYEGYLSTLPATKTTSREAAASAAAAAVLVALHPTAAQAVEAKLDAVLAAIPEGKDKADGVALGRHAARRLLMARVDDGASMPEDYRPRTQPGVYVPTGSLPTAVWPRIKPFALKSSDQFRPGPPPALTTEEWARDYNEIKSLGGKASSQRTAAQTETAKFWLMVGAPAYHPLARQIVAAKQMNLIDSARFMALYSMAMSDAYIAVFDAKYKYELWRPLTAIRNGDNDGNDKTERDASWQPIDATPAHPEYPCAHCIASGAAAAVIESAAGGKPLPELTLTSNTLPGVTHRWSDLSAFTDEVSNARIWAGFHYRFSTRVGTDMGKKIGEYAVKTLLLPAAK